MKRALWILGTAALFAVALFALLVVLLPRETLRTRIGEQIAAWTGRDVSLSGDPQISIFPRLTVTLNDVTVAGPDAMQDAEVVSMDRLTGTIRILPLIIGRVEIASFRMVHPVITLVRDADGNRNWAFDSGAAALQLAFAGDVPLGDFELENGVIVFEDRMRGESERLDSVNLDIDWSSVRNPLSIAGSGIWRGELVTFSAAADAPFDFLNGSATPLRASIESGPLQLAFEGRADDYPSPRMAGPLRVSTPSLRRLATWLGSPLRPGSTLGSSSLSGAATLRAGVLSVENAELVLDGNRGAGALEVSLGKRPEVAGTLAFTRFDLTPYFAGLARTLRTAEDWRETELRTNWFSDLTADLRLSADSVRIEGFEAGATAAAFSIRDRRLELGLARAVVNGGVLAGDLAITDAEDGSAQYEAQFRATDVALAELAALPMFPAAMTGTATASIDAVSEGATLGALVEKLSGTARLDVREGAVPLLGIADLTPGAVPSPPSPAGALAATPVTSVSASMSLAGNGGNIERLGIVAASFTADATGRVEFADGGLSVEGAIYPGGTAGSAGGEPLPFRLEGTLRRPVAVPLALAN